MNAFFSIDSTPIVALHGWGMDASCWDSLLPFLDKRMPIQTINLPGYVDESELIGMSMETVVDWLAEQFEGSCHLLGWSMGGLVAQAFAHKYSDRVETLSLVGATPCFIQKKGWDHALLSETLGQFSESLKLDKKSTLRRFIALQFMGESAAANIQKQLRKNAARQTTSLSTLALGLSWLGECDYRDQLASLTKRQHWMFGELDKLVPASAGDALQQEFPDIMISYFEGCGHAPHMTQAERFAKTLLNYISQHTSQ